MYCFPGADDVCIHGEFKYPMCEWVPYPYPCLLDSFTFSAIFRWAPGFDLTIIFTNDLEGQGQ